MLVVLVLPLVLAACNRSESRSAPGAHPASGSSILVHKEPMRRAEIEGTCLKIWGSRYWTISLEDVTIAEPDQRLDGTYFSVTGHRISRLSITVEDGATIFVRTPEQKTEWEAAIQEVLRPRDVLPTRTE